jgi:hypothetical protein
MTRTKGNRSIYLAVLLAVAVLALSVGPAGALDSASLANHAPGALTGFGFWDTLGCIGCIAGFGVAAGTTIAGFAAVLVANPELAVLCVSTCARVG